MGLFENPMVLEQASHFLGQKPQKSAILSRSCSETEVSEQL